MRGLAGIELLITLTAAIAAPPQAAKPEDGLVYFEKHIRPLFSQQCQGCHGPQKQKGGLRLDQPEFIRLGGDTGPIVKAGKPAESLLHQALSYQDENVKMPPRGKLAPEQIEHVRRWIELGAPLPSTETTAKAAAPSNTFNLHERLQHWCYQPLRTVEAPLLGDRNWARTSIDAFILAKLEATGLLPAPDAEKAVWLRRLTFDLTGLPPTPAEVADFLQDPAPQSYVRVVDRLLASPRYGERWARHWLDLVRYADTLGHEFDFDLPNAWRYRNYVIRALNEDLPYDRFVLEHLAGDLLSHPRVNVKEKWNESIQATGFLWLGEAKQAPVDVRQEQADRIDNQIDVIGKAFLGQTLACARCHDHKFDAIATRDYYALYGVLKSSRYQQACIDTPDRTSIAKTPLERARVHLQQHYLDHWKAAAPDTFRRFQGDHRATESKDDLPIDANMVQGFSRAESPDVAFDSHKKQTHARLVPAGVWDSGRLSSRSEGALRSVTFPINRPFLHVQAAGRGGRVKVVLDGFEVIREPIYGGLRRIVNEAKLHWITFDLSMWPGRQVYLECLDDGPPDLGVSDHPPGGNSWLQVGRVIPSADRSPPSLPNRLELGPVPTDAAWTSAVAEFQQAEQALPSPRYALATAEGTGDDEVVFTRGNHRLPGSKVPRGLSSVYCGTERLDTGLGSGRLALAERLIDPQRNPLLVRVVVNRVWKHHFGEGLVRSVDDFGRMGEESSHPELLEHLCGVFLKNGWSLKKLHREIVLSRTYRQSHRNDDPEVNKLDPQGRLLSHWPVRRLEAEAVRDAMLAISGQLKSEGVDEGVMPHLTPLMQGRGRPATSGPIEGAGHRSIYLSVRRNFLPPLLTAFDFPTPFSTMGRRSVSNVPAQGLALMNDPFVLEQARHWASKAVKESPDERTRLERMYLEAFTRRPSDDESRLATRFIKERDGLDVVETWTHLAHALLCSKEFIFVP
jgi:mono/diheme cytochrome c family protein